MKRFLSVIGGGFCLTLSAMAGVTINTGSIPANYEFTVNYTGIVNTDLTSQVKFFDFSYTNNVLTFATRLVNTANSAKYTSAVITSLGFNTTPNILSLDTSENYSGTVEQGALTNVFKTYGTNNNFPNQIGSVEFCTDPDTNPASPGANCQGSANDGVAMANLPTFPGIGYDIIKLTLPQGTSSFTFDNFFMRWQSISCVSGTTCGLSDSGNGTIREGQVPEPSFYGLLSAGLAGLYLLQRRRKA